LPVSKIHLADLNINLNSSDRGRKPAVKKGHLLKTLKNKGFRTVEIDKNQLFVGNSEGEKQKNTTPSKWKVPYFI
jgi:hypothetical protein